MAAFFWAFYVREIAAAYLTHGQVKVKNTKEETFGNSIRVFILLQQDHVEPLAQESRAHQLFRVLQDKFKELCIKHKTLKNIRAAGAKERRASSIGQDANSEESRWLSFKARTRKIDHGPPPKAKQFNLKFYRELVQTNSVSIKKSKPKGDRLSSGFQKKSLADLDKNGLVRSMNWRHSTFSLEIDTVRANIRRVVMDRVADTDALTEERQVVVDCLQEASRLAAGVKREAQRPIGHFCRKDSITEAERGILLSICEWVKPADIDKDEEDAGGNKENDDSDVANWQDKEFRFLISFLTYLYSRNYSKENFKAGGIANQLVVWLEKDGIHDPVRARRELQETTLFTPTYLVRSVSGQLAVECMGMGAAMKDMGIVRGDVDIQIRPDVSAVENFLYLNELMGNCHRIRKQAGNRSAVKLWSLDQVRSHLADVQNEWLDPTTYATKGYVLRGFLKNDGFRIQLLAFKLRELQDFRFRRIAEDRLPSRLTSTVGGIDYFQPEIRNVITSKDDIAKYWPGVQPEEIKTLTLDGGKACVIGAFADIPDDSLRTGNGKGVDRVTSSMEGIVAASVEPTATSTFLISPPIPISVSTQGQQTTTSPLVSTRTVFHNLAMKQKAVYQPTFRFRRWLEGEKQTLLDVGEEQRAIAGIETELPPLKGEGASVINYTAELRRVVERLLEFYAGRDQLYKATSGTWSVPVSMSTNCLPTASLVSLEEELGVDMIRQTLS
ncbi:hypothetical protein EC957_009128 [Mortierella hygrophila]|uniref:Uncharacterized protein n=1 Tax=Mortierella hygrophila TaxID=979708 RepID=A0A9P6EX96_9FUNG|nr:hypothetical protein EC957_009128 [Mortierella hygrophila]